LKNNSIYIIIVNFNCWKYTIACISSLLESTNTNFNVFIVDNNSTDNSVDEIHNWSNKKLISNAVVKPEAFISYLNSKLPVITIVNSSENNGFGAGNNIILKPLLETQYNGFTWLLNPDTEVEPKVLEDTLAIALNKERIIVGNVIHYFSSKDKIMYCGGFKVKKFIHGIVDIKKEENIKDLDAIAGASMFTHINTYKALGVLPENYFMYWEETDFCTKAKQAGYTFDVNTKSKIFDHVGVTSSGSNFLREYLYLLNGLRFYKKYYWFYLPTILMSTIAKYVKALLFEDKVKQKAVFYAHVDFFKVLSGKKIDVLSRIHSQKNKL